MRVQRAREVDVPALEALTAAAFAPFMARTGICPSPLDTDWPTVISARGVEVGVRDGRVVGVLVSWPQPGHLFVELLAVDPAVQGEGIGGALLAHAERSAVAMDLSSVQLSTNQAMTENLAWYGRHGYVETWRGLEQGYSRVRLEKRRA